MHEQWQGASFCTKQSYTYKNNFAIFAIGVIDRTEDQDIFMNRVNFEVKIKSLIYNVIEQFTTSTNRGEWAVELSDLRTVGEK